MHPFALAHVIVSLRSIVVSTPSPRVLLVHMQHPFFVCNPDTLCTIYSIAVTFCLDLALQIHQLAAYTPPPICFSLFSPALLMQRSFRFIQVFICIAGLSHLSYRRVSRVFRASDSSSLELLHIARSQQSSSLLHPILVFYLCFTSVDRRQTSPHFLFLSVCLHHSFLFGFV